MPLVYFIGMRPKQSVIICTYNRGESLVHALESLRLQSFKDFEVIIVDGGSNDTTDKVLEKFENKLQIHIFIIKEKELAKVRDLGWRKAKGEIVSWIDDDVVVSKDWAREMIKIFDKNENIGGVSGPTIIDTEALGRRDVFTFFNKKGILGMLGNIWNTIFLEGGREKVGRLFKSGAWSPGSNFETSLKLRGLVDVDYLEACNMSVRRKLVSQISGYDYSFKGVAEWCELDVSRKVNNLGYRLVFSSKVRVNHNVSQGGVYKLRTGAKERMENFLRFYFRHIFKPRWDYIWRFSLYLVFLNGYWIFKAVSSRNLDWLGGIVGTITGLKTIISKS